MIGLVSSLTRVDIYVARFGEVRSRHPGKMIRSPYVVTCCVISIGALAWSAWVIRKSEELAPLTTLAPYSLMCERARLESSSAEERESGVSSVLAVLRQIHELLDGQFVFARNELDQRFKVEVKLADTAERGEEAAASHVLNVGVTRIALGDLDRCEFELRRAAALAAQLVIDTGDSAELRVSAEMFADFSSHVSAASRLLSRLGRANLALATPWGEWARRLEAGQRQLQVRWGLADFRARSGSVDDELSRSQMTSSELQRIGREELIRWRQR